MASAKEFVQSPSGNFKKGYANSTRTTRKHELQRLMVEQLVDEDVLPDICLEVYKPLPMALLGNMRPGD